jgi:hypothetical protein
MKRTLYFPSWCAPGPTDPLAAAVAAEATATSVVARIGHMAFVDRLTLSCSLSDKQHLQLSKFRKFPSSPTARHKGVRTPRRCGGVDGARVR